MKWIRWWGVIVFVVFVAGSLRHLARPCRLHRKVRDREDGHGAGGSEGGDSIRPTCRLFPLGLKLSGLQVTNPEEPMTNAVTAGSVSMLIDGVNIFRRKVVIEEMAVEGVALNTPRKRIGATSSRAESEKKKERGRLLDRFALPSLEIARYQEILAGEDLESVNLVNRAGERSPGRVPVLRGRACRAR